MIAEKQQLGLNNEKMSVYLPSIGFDKNKNLFLTQNLSGCNIKIAFHCREFKLKMLINSTWGFGCKGFIKIGDNGNKVEIRHLRH